MNDKCAKEGARRRLRRVQQTPEAEAQRRRVLALVRERSLSVDIEALAPQLGWSGRSQDVLKVLRRRVRELVVLGEIAALGKRVFPREWAGRAEDSRKITQLRSEQTDLFGAPA